MARLALTGLVAAAAALAASAFVDTHTWAGAEYTPAAVGNSLWLGMWDTYAAAVDRELAALSKRYGFNTLRMFMHPAIYDLDNGTTLLTNLDKFLTVADSHGFKAGIVYFDDCWAGTCPGGCNVTTPCVPTKGRHNGCWVQSPLIPDRTSVERYQPYVTALASRFGSDPRVSYFEVYNEPRNNDPYSMALRSAAYAWTLPLTSKPVLSCWDQNNATQATDSHHYDTDMPSLTGQVYQNSTSGAAITEGGSRWYQGYTSDAGSTKVFLHWFNTIRGLTPSPSFPWPFGMMIQWEMMVGGSNTRWHWNTADGSPEPAIPWDAHMHADGTPVSHTEAALIRNWTLNTNDFLGYASFMPSDWAVTSDNFLSLPAGSGWTLGSDSLPEGHVQPYIAPSATAATGTAAPPSFTDFLAETTVWPSNNTGGGMLLRSGPGGAAGSMTGYFVGFRGTNTPAPSLVAEVWADDGSVTVLSTFNMASLDCGLVLDGWNMLRATVASDPATGRPAITVWANPMHPEAVSPQGIQPRFSVVVPSSAPVYSQGGVTLVAVPDAVPVSALGTGTSSTTASSSASAPATILTSRTLAETLGLAPGSPVPTTKADLAAALAAAKAKGGVADPPIVPPGTAAFDYLGVLPVSVL